MRTRVGPVLAMAAVLLAGTACLDPTTGRPPPRGATGVPAFKATVATVTAADLGASWRPGCPVGPADLRRVRLNYWGFDGTARQGDLVVHRDVVTPVTAAFKVLYDKRFQIHRIHPTSAYGGSDDASMADDNTSGFNCRKATGSSSWSEHAYGRAIDINPVENPYVKGSTVLPEQGRPYADRSIRVPGMLLADHVAVDAFEAIGWGWGGTWKTVKDHQHVSSTGR